MRVEAWCRLQIESAEIMLLCRQQQHLVQRVRPCPQELSGDPGMGGLADGQRRSSMSGFAKQHAPWLGQMRDDG